MSLMMLKFAVTAFVVALITGGVGKALEEDFNSGCIIPYAISGFSGLMVFVFLLLAVCYL